MNVNALNEIDNVTFYVFIFKSKIWFKINYIITSKFNYKCNKKIFNKR